MASKIQIINLALRRIGENKIGSITENSKAAAVAEDMWDILLESELRNWPFTWATTTVELAVIALEEPPDFEYAFQLPANYLQYIELIDAGSGTTFSQYEPWFNQSRSAQSEFEIREGKLYTNYSEITIKYIYLQQDTTQWDSSFTDAFAWRLAEEFAVPIAGRDDLRDNSFQKYMVGISKARQSNGAEGRRRTGLGTKFIKAR